uniref:Uncharacterized protein n=1 Tax=Rhizophora mucronata TaxID=61149 RepID=A0A2P2PIM5_RHIMU
MRESAGILSFHTQIINHELLKLNGFHL